MLAVAYKNTMAGAKRIVRDPQERRLSSRDRLIALSQEWQRRQDEKARQEAERKARIREQVEREKAKWAAKLEGVRALAPKFSHHDEIIARVAAWHGLTLKDIYADIRQDHYVVARRDAMAAVWLNCQLEGRAPTLNTMARAFKRDHTSVLYSLRMVGIDTRRAATSNH